MDEIKYLNFTRGMFLQDLCQKLLDRLHATQNYSDIEDLIKSEQRNLRKAHTNLWNRPISDCVYFEYLQYLTALLEGELTEDQLNSVLEEVKKRTREKIYVLFLTQEPSVWPSIASVYEAARNHPAFETALVYTPFYHVNFTEQMDYFDTYANEMGLPVIRHSDYNLEKYSPDVVFMIKPYGNIPEQFQIKHLQCVIPRAVYIPYGMEITVDLAKYGFQYYLHYKAWRHIAYGPVVKEYAKKYGYRNGENIAVWGHPKADQFRNMENAKDDIPGEWKSFINGRKVILWTPHHLIDLDSDGTGTWLLYGEQILNLAFSNPDIVFIFRPHPLLMGALINNGIMTENSVERLKERIDHAPNLIWDTNSEYRYAFNAADAIITDGTTFSIEFLYTKKPILLTPRNMEGFYHYEQMQESYYIVNRIQDVSDFIKMIREEKDPLREKRLQMHKDTFFLPADCTVGENIMENIKRDLTEDCCIALKDKQDNTKIEDDISLSESVLDTEKFPLVSILVLCYKNFNLLFKMLDSIFRQDYPRIQLIVSDDGSDDFDVDQVTQYINSHKRHNIEQVMVLKNKENMGTVRHIDKALKSATGEYIVFTAADDRFTDSDTISCYIDNFLSNPDKIWLISRCKVTSGDYKKLIYITPTSADEPYLESGQSQVLFSRCARRGIAIPCCMAFRKDAFEIVGGIDLSYRFLEDYPIILKLLRNGHMPIYIRKISAIHSAGGISNSNQRYGIERRKAFYDDKYQLYKKEVEPYMDLLTPGDKKAYRQYQREIMERHYFFYIDYPNKSIGERLKLCLKKPIRLWWVFEQQFMKRKDKIKRKKMLVISQLFFLLSMLFFVFNGCSVLNVVFDIMGIIDLTIASLLFVASIVTYPLKKYFIYKARLRSRLVN